jgi:hypothetical protein
MAESLIDHSDWSMGPARMCDLASILTAHM